MTLLSRTIPNKFFLLWSSKKWIKVEPRRDDSAKPEVVEASYDHGAEGQGHGQHEAAVVVGVLADQVDAAYKKWAVKFYWGLFTAKLCVLHLKIESLEANWRWWKKNFELGPTVLLWKIVGSKFGFNFSSAKVLLVPKFSNTLQGTLALNSPVTYYFRSKMLNQDPIL